MELRVRKVEAVGDPEAAFAALYGEREDAFWLDSSRVGEGARFSFIGAPGPLGAEIDYEMESGEVRVERGGGGRGPRRIDLRLSGARAGATAAAGGRTCPSTSTAASSATSATSSRPSAGGRRRTGPRRRTPPSSSSTGSSPSTTRTPAPTCSAWPSPAAEEEAESWLAETEALLATLPGDAGAGREPEPAPGAEPVEFDLARSRQGYLEDIDACKQRLRDGESYEICLTNRVRANVEPGEPLALYRSLRRVNPAPYAAYLRLGATTVLSSSPERFLRIGADGAVEAKPIKGTAARGATPAEDARLAAALHADEKNRAENLMIVDLLRNDLGRVCEVGSVEVPRLMEVESFATVHQLVSTVRGRLRQEVGPLGCVRACFPPGSMTGAPKERTMAIIDELEGRARGVYSGAIGYLGLGGGCDLSVAIRAIVIDPGGEVGIGSGGAIVAQSEPEGEFEEMLLKARAPLRAIAAAATLYNSGEIQIVKD